MSDGLGITIGTEEQSSDNNPNLVRAQTPVPISTPKGPRALPFTRQAQTLHQDKDCGHGSSRYQNQSSLKREAEQQGQQQEHERAGGLSQQRPLPPIPGSVPCTSRSEYFDLLNRSDTRRGENDNHCIEALSQQYLKTQRENLLRKQYGIELDYSADRATSGNPSLNSNPVISNRPQRLPRFNSFNQTLIQVPPAVAEDQSLVPVPESEASSGSDLNLRRAALHSHPDVTQFSLPPSSGKVVSSLNLSPAHRLALIQAYADNFQEGIHDIICRLDDAIASTPELWTPVSILPNGRPDPSHDYFRRLHQWHVQRLTNGTPGSIPYFFPRLGTKRFEW